MIKTQPSFCRNRLLALGVSCVIATLCGCQGDPIVLHESVPVTRNIDGGSEDGEPKYRMVTAIAERPEATWFFKLTGPIEDFDAVKDGWDEFLDSVRYPGREPEWKLPQEWSSDGFQDLPMPGGMKMRIANIATSQDEVTVSVSSLPPGQELLANVNRWRGQLGLAATNAVQLAMQLSEVSNDEVSFRIFDASGPTLSTRMGGAPFARGSGNRPPSPHGNSGETKDETNRPASTSHFDFDQPTGWEAGSTSSMILGSWKKETEEGSVQMKLLTMNATDESWKLNVEAWARQVRIEPGPEIDEVTETVDVAGSNARSVQLQGPADDKPAVRAVMFQNPAGKGFVLQLTGQQPAVDAVADDFQSLLDSIKFENSG